MRLPGTRYQEPGWERVRKLLGSVSLTVLQAANWPRLKHEPMLDWYVEAMALALQQVAASSRAQAAGNSYGESALELAQVLVCELRALSSFWQAFVQALPDTPDPACAALLRKKINDMYVSLRDRVDADYYQIATGRACSANKIYTWRMLDTAYHEVERLLLDWQNHGPQLSAILGREIQAQPIESRRLKSAADCDPHWIIRWSASLQQFGHGTGPLHTRSKRFSSLKNNPATIAALLREIADYEALAHSGGEDWQLEDEQFGDWVDDYFRVMQESRLAQAQESQVLQRQEARGAGVLAVDHAFYSGITIDEENGGETDPEFFDGQHFDSDFPSSSVNLSIQLAPALEESGQAADIEFVDAGQTRILAALQAEGLLDVPLTPAALPFSGATLAADLSLPPGYMQRAQAAEDRDSLMYRALQHESLAVRLALYSKQLGAWDDSYPDAWLDPGSGELPTMKQLAALDGISLPTLRKRRDMALQRLQAASDQRNRG